MATSFSSFNNFLYTTFRISVLDFEHFRKLDSQRLLENNFETTKLQNKSFSILFIHVYLFTLDTACFQIAEISVKIL